VTELARDRGLHEPVHTRLMHAYWSEGRDLGDDDVLLELVTEAGLDRDEAAETIAEDRYVDRVTASTQEANRIGINAIPAFVLDRRLLVLGAQPEMVFEQAVNQLRSEPEPAQGD
jgi:predicted DsbA family dithiol-disulfide isomerase